MKVNKELSEATADLLRQQSVFQIGLKQFRGMCRYVALPVVPVPSTAISGL